MKKLNMNFILILFFVAFSILTRLIPHISNFTSVFALGIFTFASTKNKLLSSLLPVFVMFISDIFLGFYPDVWAVYASLTIALLLSSLVMNNLSSRKIVLNSFVSPTIFFILSNLAIFPYWYPVSFSGLMQCYYNAIPFYGYSLISTLAYSFAFFGLNKLITKENLLTVNTK